MSIERIWLLVNKRRAARGKEPLSLSRIQRVIRLLWPAPPKPTRPLAFKGYSKPAAPFRRWDLTTPQCGRPPFKSDNRR